MEVDERWIQGGLRVTRKTATTIIKELEPEGVELRRSAGSIYGGDCILQEDRIEFGL